VIEARLDISVGCPSSSILLVRPLKDTYAPGIASMIIVWLNPSVWMPIAISNEIDDPKNPSTSEATICSPMRDGKLGVWPLKESVAASNVNQDGNGVLAVVVA
jgi:hypothetical protein